MLFLLSSFCFWGPDERQRDLYRHAKHTKERKEKQHAIHTERKGRATINNRKEHYETETEHTNLE